MAVIRAIQMVDLIICNQTWNCELAGRDTDALFLIINAFHLLSFSAKKKNGGQRTFGLGYA